MLHDLPTQHDPNLLIGFATADDAAVYKVSEDVAIIETVDFFPPMVDDPFTFGQVAAANALSDIYAMGGTPKLALNLLCFPSDRLSPEHVRAILLGGADKVAEAGAVLCGGHTIEDKEPKYGLAVTGFVHPDKILSNAAAHPGDKLLLTKPIGSGILNTAAKGGLLSKAETAELIRTMTALNAAAAKAMARFTVRACTDITGFGLIGHALEMATASGCSIALDMDAIPLLAGTLDFARMGVIPAGAYRNREQAAGRVSFAPTVPLELTDAAFDPQTSGGLLISAAPESAQGLLAALTAVCPEARIIGEVRPKGVFALTGE